MPRTKKVENDVEVKKENAPTEEVKPAKKARTRKAKEVVEVYVEYNNKQELMQTIIDNVKSAYEAENEKAEIKTLKIYVKPDENAAYYVVNDEETRKIDVFFC